MFSLESIATKIFGSSNDRKLKDYQAKVEEINEIEPDFAKLSDDELREKTKEFRAQLEEGVSLDDLLVPAFATVREAAKRTLGQRHYDVQLIGGMVLNDGKIAEMKTGEGKTLVGTLPVYLNGLTGKGVHVVTVNDYLAGRDAGWMGQVYEFLGLTVGCILPDMDSDERQKQYKCDITFGTNNEFGFDYLRDNLEHSTEDMVQRGHYFAIVDEVDSILIDEARTPLIISGPIEDRSELYMAVDKLLPLLVEEDFTLDEKDKNVTLTEAGNEHVEQLLEEAGLLKNGSLYDAENVTVVHHVNNALRAHKLFRRDKDYIVKRDQVIIIDEFTGRMMEGRRYSDGLHQALEAKEGVSIQQENQTLASVTFQNYFRLYEKLGGMTGTALTEADEFLDIYKLQVIEIPTNLPVSRVDYDDEIYRTAKEKYDAIIDLLEDCQKRKQPALVGTTSIEKSEYISELLKKRKIKHKVLNARYHEEEAHIVAQAGVPGAITIATNMAGRGTDIQLGGNLDMIIDGWKEEQEKKGKVPTAEQISARTAEIKKDIEQKKRAALDSGGLYVIASERHESRRIDNQLRGRSGRQGDPGASKFFLSLEDDLMRIFGSQRMDKMLQTLGLEEGEAIAHPWINKALAKAQQKVESHNFDIRKNVLKYDDVMNDQRKAIFEQRVELMQHDDVKEMIDGMREDVVYDLVAATIPEKAYAEQWDTAGLKESVREVFGLDLPVDEWAKEEGIADEEIRERLMDEVKTKAAKREVEFTSEFMRAAEKQVLLGTLDGLWREHLLTLEHLRQVVGLRGYGQRDPLNEYKTESFALFESLLSSLREEVTKTMMHAEPYSEDELVQLQQLSGIEAHHHQLDEFGMEFDDEEDGERPAPIRNRQEGVDIDPNNPQTWGKVGRNAECPCGSGKKYKRCHGKIS
ncbi:MAG: preprotein translocase subunit SecA [Methyloligellaceae bacterium]